MTIGKLIRYLRRLPEGELLSADIAVLIEHNVVVTLSLDDGTSEPEDGGEGVDMEAAKAKPYLRAI